MGQKVSPISLRIGITQQWRSRWYARKKDYGKFAVEDERIRRFIKKHYALAGIPKIEIERTLEKIVVIVHTARPGILIGRRGATVEKLTDELDRLVGHPVELKIVEVTQPELSAQLVAESVALQLEKRLAYRRVLHQTSGTVMEAGAQGVKIQMSGRIGGIEIARSENIYLGKIPLHTFRADIDYGAAEAVLTKGKVGIKVWIFKREQLPEDKKPLPGDKKAEMTKVTAPLTGSADNSAPTPKQE